MLEINKIYHMDCLKGMAQLPDESVDLAIADPPYYINYHNFDWDKTNSFTIDTEKWLKEIFRVLKPHGTLWSFMGYQQIFEFVPLLNHYGTCHLENWIIAAHAKGRGTSKHCRSIREDIFHVTKHPTRYVWNNLKTLREVISPYIKNGRPRGWFVIDIPDETCQIVKKRVRWTGLGNVWHYSWPQHNSICEKQIHPCQKPVMLIERLIRLSSNEGNLILDPFMGSGTTAIAAKICNRNYIGFENDQGTYEKCLKRIETFDITKFTEYNAQLDLLFAQTHKMQKAGIKS